MQQIGQLFVCGFEGIRPNGTILRLIREYGIGGVILFSRNIETPRQTAELVQELQAAAKIPLFIGIDQEGGRVSRLPSPFTRFPGNDALGRTASGRLACRFGRAVGKELAVVGINLDFAPVLDINTRPDNPVIGTRAFGSDPTIVSDLGCAVIDGLQKEIIACGKHFPGHGDTSLDSHLTLPEVPHGIDLLRRRELIPFIRAVACGVESIMTAHVLYRPIDPDYPATLSPKIVQGILRKELHFNGVVFSDDLEMKAVEDHFGIETSSILALQAGVDSLLICHHPEKQEKAIEAVTRSVEEGAISLSRIEESAGRILDLKRRRLSPKPSIDFTEAEETAGWPEHRKLAEEIERPQGGKGS
ncbi:MAG: beta-N-acetylhexosaminidase [Deltaproteobacteria bacterium]|nr:beta-N-acetylhexosaminidase [Deltaproteobacteria bacterium]